jgi:hypothetical protein
LLTLPPATAAGTHELRLFGVTDPPVVRFAVRAADAPPADLAPRSADDDTHAARLFAGAAALLLLLVALARLGIGLLRRRRAAA